MTPKLEFCLLGPVMVRYGGVPFPVPRGRQRAVLAVLLLNAGRVVSVGEIAETLWGAAPLPSAPATVRNYVKRLRRVLGDAGRARIVTRSPGYVILVDPALYRDGRQAEALAAYQHARRVLVDELGTEPGAELRELHGQILTTGPEPASPEPGPLPPGARPVGARRVGARPGPVLPRELPGPVPRFVGRAAELAELTGMLERAGADRPQTLVISAITGMAGVGKTALATQWAHQVAHRFPDGQLHVNLRGYDPGQPVPAADALTGFLRSLGVAEQDIPAGTAERAARYRSLLAGRRMLIVIDNAGDVDQVRPLLPGSPSCVTVVTSRDALAGLVARDGAHRLALGLLPLAEAVGLLRALVGERVDAEPEATVTLAGYCARYAMHDLLRAYAADQAADHDSAPELKAALTRLYDHYLATAAAAAGTLFRADPDQPVLPQPTGPVPPVTSPAAALAWLDAQRSTLVAVAAHAGDRDAEAAALTMLGAAEAAQGRLSQATSHFEQALTLCRQDGNRIGEARALGHLGMAAYCYGHYQQSAECHRTALAIYLEGDDHVGEARELHNLGVVALRQGRYEQAAGHLRRSLALFRDAGLRSGEATVLGDLGDLELRQGRYVQAAAHLRRSLGLAREIGNRLSQARALAWLGTCELRQGRRQQAIGHLRQSLALHSQAGNRSGQAEALNGLGEAFLAASQAGQASAQHAAALALAIQCGDKHERARAHNGLATACQAG